MVPSRFQAFTLIELLTVIAIIGILAAITLTAISRVRAQAHQARCGSNIRQLAALAAVWSQDNKDWVPQAMWAFKNIHQKRVGATSLRNYGYTENLGRCGAVSDTTLQTPHYGINNILVSGSDVGSQWGDNTVQFWEHGRYKLSAVLNSRAIAFAETKYVSGYTSDVNGTGDSRTGAFMSADVTLDARHNGKFYAAYTDGHIALLTPEYMKDTTIKPWVAGIRY